MAWSAHNGNLLSWYVCLSMLTCFCSISQCKLLGTVHDHCFQYASSGGGESAPLVCHVTINMLWTLLLSSLMLFARSDNPNGVSGCVCLSVCVCLSLRLCLRVHHA
eukprot:scpid112478/ scgid22595/ 